MVRKVYKENRIKKLMEVNKYLSKRVKVDLANGYYYEGMVNSIDKDSINIKDKNGLNVSIKKEVILFIREIP